jgi:hypothetical protein
MPKPTYEKWLDVLMGFVSYWEERLGASFKVGEVDLVGLKAQRDAFQTTLQELAALQSQVDEKMAQRDAQADELHQVLKNLRMQVAIDRGKESPEYSACPRLQSPRPPKPKSGT